MSTSQPPTSPNTTQRLKPIVFHCEPPPYTTAGRRLQLSSAPTASRLARASQRRQRLGELPFDLDPVRSRSNYCHQLSSAPAASRLGGAYQHRQHLGELSSGLSIC
ncbi:hypothetical protein AKJ16_DCAP13294 [Drosera capensis]